jgi:hypothetical protein
MKKIIDYKLIATSGSRLAGSVKSAISRGWEPLGGPCLQGGLLCQAVVKYDRTTEDLLTDQINAIHSTQVMDIPEFFREWREHQSYPRMVKETK